MIGEFFNEPRERFGKQEATMWLRWTSDARIPTMLAMVSRCYAIVRLIGRCKLPLVYRVV